MSPSCFNPIESLLARQATAILVFPVTSSLKINKYSAILGADFVVEVALTFFFTLILAPPLIQLIYGTGCEGSAPLLRWLPPGHILNVSFYVAAFALPAVDRQRTLARLSLAGIGLTVVMSALFIYGWKEIGAAVGLSVASLFLAAPGIWQIAKSRLEVFSRANLPQLAALLPSIAIAVGLRFFQTPVTVSVVVVGLVFYVSLFCFGGFTEKEKLFVRSFSARVLSRNGRLNS